MSRAYVVPCSRGNQLLPRKLCILKCTDAYYKGFIWWAARNSNPQTFRSKRKRSTSCRQLPVNLVILEARLELARSKASVLKTEVSTNFTIRAQFKYVSTFG